MAIETICRGCARKLRVGDEFAGRKARCPHCKTIYTVPDASGVGESSGEAAVGASDRWLLRTDSGTVYGPVSRSELDRWCEERRLDASSQVRPEGESTWRRATELYPSLQAAVTSDTSPFAAEPTFSVTPANPYSSSSTSSSGRSVEVPHRGGLILTFALVGIVCCPLFSIFAWVMGHLDMKEINAARMDPSGRGLTQAGMIIGIVGTVMMVFSFVPFLIMMLFAIFAEM